MNVRMKKRTHSQNAQLHKLLTQLGLMDDKEEFVIAYTDGRTKKSSEMYEHECQALIDSLKKASLEIAKNSPENNQRRRIIAICYDMGWTDVKGKWDKERLNGFLLSRGVVKKNLQQQDTKELNKTIQQLEQLRNKHLNEV